MNKLRGQFVRPKYIIFMNSYLSGMSLNNTGNNYGNFSWISETHKDTLIFVSSVAGADRMYFHSTLYYIHIICAKSCCVRSCDVIVMSCYHVTPI